MYGIAFANIVHTKRVISQDYKRIDPTLGNILGTSKFSQNLCFDLCMLPLKLHYIPLPTSHYSTFTLREI